MKHEEIDALMKAIDMNRWPEEPIIPVDAPFENAAGKIWNLAWGMFGSATAISSVPGSVRSNHYHRTDWHFIYVVSGLMYYYFRPTGSTSTPARRRCPPGTLVFTPPLVEHATFFPEETFVVTLNDRTRDHESHEGDLVRLASPLVTGEVCPAVFDGVKCRLPWQHVEGRDFRHPIHDGDHEAADGRTFGFNVVG